MMSAISAGREARRPWQALITLAGVLTVLSVVVVSTALQDHILAVPLAVVPIALFAVWLWSRPKYVVPVPDRLGETAQLCGTTWRATNVTQDTVPYNDTGFMRSEDVMSAILVGREARRPWQTLSALVVMLAVLSIVIVAIIASPGTALHDRALAAPLAVASSLILARWWGTTAD